MLWDVVLNRTNRISELVLSHRVFINAIKDVMETWEYRKIDPCETKFYGENNLTNLQMNFLYEKKGTVYLVQNVNIDMNSTYPPSIDIQEIGFLK